MGGSFYRGTPSTPQIGDVKVQLKSNNLNNGSLTATVLGRNNAGTIGIWTAPSSWLCSGFTLGDLRMGTISPGKFFDQLAAEESGLTWVLRFIGFIVMWIAFCLCFGPLGVAADCVPCIGPMLGDSIAAISCCVACLPATACTLGVAGVCWVVMRPLIGVPLLLVFCAITGGLGAFIGKQRAKRGGRAVQVGVAQTSLSQPMAPQPRAPPVAMA